MTTDFLFGESTNSLLPNTPFATEEFLSNLNIALAGVGKRRSAGTLAFRYYFDKTFPSAIAKVHAFIDQHVSRALSATSPDSKAPPPSDSPSSGRYILLNEMALQIRDPIALRSQIFNVFMPSRDTTAILLSNALFQLSRHPSVWTSLRTTALSLGNDQEQPTYTFESLKSLLPFRHVIFETLRTLGPSGRVIRSANRDTILPHGGGPDGNSPVFVPKGTDVALFIWGLHHSRETWGADAYEFKPERWDGKKAPMWEFVPFLGGPRICPAMQQVLVQATYVLVRLTREFERIECRDEVREYVVLARMLTESRNGVKVGLVPPGGEEEGGGGGGEKRTRRKECEED